MNTRASVPFALALMLLASATATARQEQTTSPGSQTPAASSAPSAPEECRRHCNQKIDEMLNSCLWLLNQKRNAEAGECGQRTQNFIQNCIAAEHNAEFATCPN
jgi:hypothetical protein